MCLAKTIIINNKTIMILNYVIHISFTSYVNFNVTNKYFLINNYCEILSNEILRYIST